RCRCSTPAAARRTGRTCGATARGSSSRTGSSSMTSPTAAQASTRWRSWANGKARCLAHARRKFYELWTNHSSQIAEEALSHFGKLYDVEREVRELSADERR